MRPERAGFPVWTTRQGDPEAVPLVRSAVAGNVEKMGGMCDRGGNLFRSVKNTPPRSVDSRKDPAKVRGFPLVN